MKKIILLFSSVIVMLMLAGCGQTGPLYLPQNPHPHHHMTGTQPSATSQSSQG